MMPDAEINILRRDECPDCKSKTGFKPGPRAGGSQTIFCIDCGAGFNVGQSRFIVFAQRIAKD